MSTSRTPAKFVTAALEPIGECPGVFSMDALADIVLITWHGATTLESMPIFEALCAQTRQRFARGISCAHLITSQHPRLPDGPTRDELARINQAYSDLAACCAVVIPLQGFLGSALRGLVTAITLKTRPDNVELKIVGTIEEAAEWLAPAHLARTGRAIAPEELLAAMRQVTTRS